MYKFFYFDDQDAAVPEEIVEAAADEGAASEPDYSQLLYEYLSSQDVITGTRQEEMYAAYTEKLESIDSRLLQLNKNFEWWLGSAVSEVAGMYQTSFNLIGLSITEFGALVLLATSLGFIGSYLSVNRYIKEIEPDKV